MNEISQIISTIKGMREQLQDFIPSCIDLDSFIASACLAVSMYEDKEKLAKAKRQSVYSAIMKACRDGLMLDGVESTMQHRNKNVGTKTKPNWVILMDYVPMYQGLVRKALRNPDILKVEAHIVYEKDHFEYWIDDDGQHVKHVPCLKKDRGERELGYAVCRMKGSTQIEIMLEHEMEEVRKCSPSGDYKGEASGIWKKWPDAMRKKTVFKKMEKWLPVSSDKPIPEDYNQPEEETDEQVTATPSDTPKKTRAEAIIEAQTEPDIQESPETVEGDLI